MSHRKNRHKVWRWLQTAEEDLRAAELLIQGEHLRRRVFILSRAVRKP